MVLQKEYIAKGSFVKESFNDNNLICLLRKPDVYMHQASLVN